MAPYQFPDRRRAVSSWCGAESWKKKGEKDEEEKKTSLDIIIITIIITFIIVIIVYTRINQSERDVLHVRRPRILLQQEYAYT